MLKGSGEREKGLPGASWAAGWRRCPLDSDGSWWEVAGGGIGRGAELEPPAQTGQAGRAGLLLLLHGGAESGAGPAQEALTLQEGILVGRRHGLSFAAGAVECVVRG